MGNDYSQCNSLFILWSRFLSLSPTIPRESLIVLKDSLLSLPTGIIRKWGDILMTSDIACEDVREEEWSGYESGFVKVLRRMSFKSVWICVFMQAINVCLLPQSPCWEVSFTIERTRNYGTVWQSCMSLFYSDLSLLWMPEYDDMQWLCSQTVSLWGLVKVENHIRLKNSSNQFL